MTDGENKEVKDIERVEVTPTKDDELIDEEETSPESSKEEKPEGEPAEDIENPPETDPKKPEEPKTPKIEVDGIKRLPDETDREYGLRLENKRLRSKLRDDQAKDILSDQPKPSAKTEEKPESKRILEKYKPEQIKELKDVFSVLADDMGFVKKGEIESKTFMDKGEETLQEFIESHPEYKPENDSEGIAWGKFKQEYGLYKPPSTIKDLKRLLDKVHKDIYGVQPKGDLGKINAQKEKIKVASHSGAPSPAAQNRERPTTKQRTAGLRTDMLKGFTEEEIANLTAE